MWKKNDSPGFVITTARDWLRQSRPPLCTSRTTVFTD